MNADDGTPRRAADPLRLVIDTDTASDDAVALLLACAEPMTEIEAVTTVAGNVPLDMATRNALIALDIGGRGDVPVYPGCERPLRRPLETAQHVHGVDGMGDVGLPDPARSAQSAHAVERLLELARSRPGELTLVTLGPLTNVAAALVRDRDLLRRFRHVYSMAGAADAHGNVSPVAEFNVWADPEAAAIVLDAGGPITFVGWDVSRRYAVMDADDQARLLAMGTVRADFAHRINRSVAEWAATVTGLKGYDLPDPVAMAVALRPKITRETERVHATVAVGDEARGALLVDRRANAPAANVDLVRVVDSSAFKEMLFGACADGALLADTLACEAGR
ncbi:nucleoside hydrolase [Actinoallomurus sp. CA-150999]|uniref:nucleoside hydrolase n=1 Tax=Actinoallomurus sp. CA-150999 TaxID=3239887 RepID=UPI003D8DCEA9